MRAVTFLAAYSEGVPAQTNVHLHSKVGDGDSVTLEETLRQSPAMRRRLKQALASIPDEDDEPVAVATSSVP
jgi:hypothetical protein